MTYIIYEIKTETTVDKLISIMPKHACMQLNAIVEFDTYERLPQIRVSAPILHGKRDILVPPENAAVLAEAIPNAKLVYFENSVHGLVEEMEKVIHFLLDFLTES